MPAAHASQLIVFPRLAGPTPRKQLAAVRAPPAISKSTLSDIGSHLLDIWWNRIRVMFREYTSCENATWSEPLEGILDWYFISGYYGAQYRVRLDPPFGVSYFI